MSLLLDLLYLLGFTLASPWIAYRLFAAGAWRTLPMRAGLGLPPAARGGIWLHGSSVGEISLLRPLIAMLEREMPDTPLLISAFTATGLEAARTYYPRHRVIAFPLDFSFVVRRFLRHFAPRLVVVVESDFWPNFLAAVGRRGIASAVLNGKMSARSLRLHRRTRVVPLALRGMNLFAVQSEEHAERLRSLGVPAERVFVTGNMKYDLAALPAESAQREKTRKGLGYAADDIVIIGGSLHAGEDEALIDAFCALDGGSSQAALLIVPRYPAEAGRAAEHVAARRLAAVVKSAVDGGAASAPGRGGVLIVDSVGELGRLYAAADIAFVGGSLFYRGANKGGHNLMEPAILGLPVVFGPYNFSFKETVDDLLRAEAGLLVRDPAELAEGLARLVGDAPRRREMGRKARAVVLAGQGATARNFALLRGLIVAGERLQPSAADRTMPPATSHSDGQ
jgi:3-deoxy-D-manno-octulosonic-acid transferase